MGVSVRQQEIYCHTVPGRMRLKQSGWRGAPGRAGRVAQMVRQVVGVTDATANPTTGSLLILFDPRQTGPEALIAFLEERGEIRPGAEILVTPSERLAGSRAHPLASLAWSAGTALGKEILRGAIGHALRDTPWSILLSVV
jgi:hypothetical protein